MILRFDKKYSLFFALTAILLLSLIVYWPAFFADFTNFDDNRYVTENPLIWSLSSNNIVNIFTSYYDGHYHPLTLFSLAIDYSIAENNPWLFHFVNILLHLINTLLVFVFIRKLITNEFRNTFAVIVSLLFGIHTFHVESVAWISERKDVLFGLFFLLSLISYLKYLEKKKLTLIWLSVLFFILSCLSKGQAVALAPSLVLIDYYKNRNIFSKKLILEKLPFFIIAGFFGYLAMKAHATFPYISSESFPLYDRIVYACYGFFLYIGKIIIPIELSAYYPYPDGSPGLAFLFFPLLLLILFALLVYFFKKNRLFVFSTGFFLVNLILVLKIFEVHLQTGKFIIADRYSYIPSIGIFILMAYLFILLLEKKKNLKLLAGTILVTYIIVLSILSFQRVKVWDNSISLWNSVINKYPNLSWAYGKRALAKSYLGDFKGAFEDNTLAIKYDPKDPHAWNNRGKLRAQTAVSANLLPNNLKDSLLASKKDLDKSIENGPTFFEAFANRGLVNLYLGNLDAALNDLNKAVKYMPTYAVSYYNRGLVLAALGKDLEAIADFNEALELNPRLTMSVFYRGISNLKMGKLDLALEDFSFVINENSRNIAAYVNRAIAYEAQNNLSNALQDLNYVLQIQPNNAEAYFRRGNIVFKKGAIPSAIEDYKKALTYYPNFGNAWYNLGLAYFELDSISNACKCLEKAENIGFDISNCPFTEKCK
ncbi:MAG: tetratricopeptide repeat protein [Bacteroidales bacterium]|nr:tetratricopeptide repeat protein [Bacteroidales bacterium]